ncbi:MAG: hypothetical protein E6J91_46030 [Deltaproteobacteria bacterium]|nr:MAG: hypothetical protein E6J91_46030 [Deltaproteobacteria bacterium]
MRPSASWIWARSALDARSSARSSMRPASRSRPWVSSSRAASSALWARPYSSIARAVSPSRSASGAASAWRRSRIRRSSAVRVPSSVAVSAAIASATAAASPSSWA